MSVRSYHPHSWLLAWLLTLACATGAQAQTSVMIWPLDPVIEDDQRASALWLENRGNQAVMLQIRVLAWSQDGREESYGNQEGVVPSPPSATIQPGQRQLVRLMKLIPAPEGQERAYRILVDELPSAASLQDQAQSGGNAMGVKLQIRYSVPLFVSGKGHWIKPRTDLKRDASSMAQPALSWRLQREGADHYLLIRNTGSTRARLTAIEWARGSEVRPINPGLLGYVLANSQMRWKLERPPPPAGYALRARVNAGDKPVELAAQ